MPGDWAGRSVLVAGAGIAGTACAEALLARGAQVTVVDRAESERTEALVAAGATVVVEEPAQLSLLEDADELVVSPGFPPHHPLAAEAVARGLDVYSEPELAWRLQREDAGTAPPPVWLGITGTNGKTTTTTMLAAILGAAGRASAALGNIGQPLVTAQGYEVIAVELSSQQLYWSRDLAPTAGVMLNLADDHLDWQIGRAHV